MKSDHPANVRCVALDFDLTMFDYSRPSDTLVLGPWFKRLHKDGLMLGIASGRTLADLQYELEKIGMSWRKNFPEFVIHEEFYIHWPGSKAAAEIALWNAECAAEVKEVCQVMRPFFDACAEQMAGLGIGIKAGVEETAAGLTLVLENPPGAEQARLLLQEIAGPSNPARISRNHHILLATPANHHKGAALEKLRSLAGFAPAEVLAVGDNLNDLAMMDHSLGFRCATVGNAEADVSRLVAERGGHQASAAIAFGVVELLDALFAARGLHAERQAQPHAGLSSPVVL